MVGTATTDLTNWIGFAKAAASTGAIVDVYYSGVALVRSTGTVNPGDCLVSTTSAAGYVTGDSTPTTGADSATALATGITTGGLVKARLR
jgi:hypothetical protein